jgi:hypothetical protein
LSFARGGRTMPFLAAIPAGVYAGISAGVSLLGAGIGAIGAMAGAQQQAAAANAAAAAQEQQARQAMQIAQYNAEIQRQNAEVQYNMAVYQAQTNQQIAAMNQAMMLGNAEFAKVQAYGAQQQYEQGIQNAKQQGIEAEAVRAQGREEARRKREENEIRLATIRSKYGASGVTFEGSPLVVLADAAGLGEVAVQDIAYATELQSRKDYRQAEIEKFKAGFSLIEKAGYEQEAANYRVKAQISEYEANLYEYDQAIAGAKYRIGLNEARLIELGGQVQAYGYQAEAQQSRYQAQAARTTGFFGAANSLIGGIGGVAKQFSTPDYSTRGLGVGRMPSYSSSFGGANAAGYRGYG